MQPHQKKHKLDREKVPDDLRKWLLKRAHYEHVGKKVHLLWDGPTQTHGGVPITHKPGTVSGTITVKRRIAEECGVVIPKGWWVYSDCGNKLCVEPHHLAIAVPSIALKGHKVNTRTLPQLRAQAERSERMKQWSDEQAAEACRLWGTENLTYERIAQIIGCPKTTVHYLIKRHLTGRTKSRSQPESVFSPAAVFRAAQPRTPGSAAASSPSPAGRSRAPARATLQAA